MIIERPLLGKVDAQFWDGSAWVPLLPDATGVTIRRGGRRDGLTVKTDVGLLTFTLKNAHDPLAGGGLAPGMKVRAGVYIEMPGDLAGWYCWDLTGGADFPPEAPAGDLGYDSTTGNLYTNGPASVPPLTDAAYWYLTGDFPPEARAGDVGIDLESGAVYVNSGFAEIFTGRIAHFASAYPMDKNTGKSTTRVSVTVADAVQIHGSTMRYGVDIRSLGDYETFEDRIGRLASSANAPMDVPVAGAPIVRYAL